MNLSAYEMNLRYQKTQLSYDMSISKVDPNEQSQELVESNSNLAQSNINVVYMSEDQLNDSEILSKMILEATYSQYSSSNATQTLFPNVQTTNSQEIPSEIQAYGNKEKLPDGLVYNSNSEYYEKTSFDFSGEIRIKTPEGEYNIALNLSYTEEFYEKNATFVEMASQNLQNPLEIVLDEDNENLKGLNTINLLFESTPEEKNTNDFFTQMIESLQQSRDHMDALFTKKQEKQMDNYQVYMSKNEESYQLVSAQKDGFGVFFSDTISESAYFEMGSNANGSYISAGYSSSQTTSISSFESIKA